MIGHFDETIFAAGPMKIRMLRDCRELECVTICSVMIRVIAVMFSMLVLFRRVAFLSGSLVGVVVTRHVGCRSSVCFCSCSEMSSLEVTGYGLLRARWCLSMCWIVCMFGRSIGRGSSEFVLLSVPFHIYFCLPLRRNRGRIRRCCQTSSRSTSRKSVVSHFESCRSFAL